MTSIGRRPILVSQHGGGLGAPMDIDSTREAAE
jgi:hypothetical protein